MAGLEIQQDAFHGVAFSMSSGAGLVAEVDEDLINYDSDVGEKNDATNDASWHQIPTTADADADDEVEVALGTASADPEKSEENDEHEILIDEGKNPAEQNPSVDDRGPASAMTETRDQESTEKVEEAEEHDIEDVTNDHIEDEVLVDLESERIDLFATDEQSTTMPQEINNYSIPSQEGSEGAHEIDYDMDEPDTVSFAEHQEETALENDQSNEQPKLEDESFAQQATSEQNESGFSQAEDDDNAASLAMEHEIVWEEEEEVTDTKSNDEPAVAETVSGKRPLESQEEDPFFGQDAQSDEGQQNEEAQVIEDSHDQTAGLGEEFEQIDPDTADHVSEDASPATPGEQYDFTTAHSESEAAEAAEAAEALDFPSITVQYKGDEFPFFSASSDGFFADPAVLDGDIKSLMAGFRAELTNEIASDEELVFQVDELGLEFAESSLDTTLSSITMRQVLDVFDILVKNQDPDSSRVLYTYLFTRPSTSKRFESLVESATAGKGLDEVIHLFASPMPHGNRVVIQSTHGTESHDEDFETYESAEDMEQDDEEHLDQTPTQRTTDELDYEEADVNDDEDAPEGSDPQAHEAVSPGHDESGPADAQGLDSSLEEGDSGQSGAPEADFEQTYSNQQTQEDMPPMSGVTPLPVTDDVSFDHQEVSASHDVAEGNVTHATTAETSTTHTLEDDGGVNSALADTDFDLNVDQEFSQEVLDEQDELAEIDWRSEAGDAEEPAEGVHAPGKRPRTDDEVTVDNEKDAKRLRS